MTRPNISILFPLLIAAAGAGLMGCQETARRSTPPPNPVAAQVVALANESVPALVEVPGSVHARNRIVLSAQVNGFVREMHVREGDTVGTGQLLATLDARDAESQKAIAQAGADEAKAALAEARQALQASQKTLAAARSSAALAESTLARYQKLLDTHSVSPQELDEVRARRDASADEVSAREAMASAAQDRIRQVEARIAQADAQLRRAEVVVGWTTVSAPARGRVVQRTADPGSAIFPGSPLLAIETTGDLQVLATLPAAQAGLLRRGMEVAVRRDATPSSAIQGTVSEIIPASDPATHTLQFKVDLPVGTGFLPGDFVKARIPAGSRQALLVPRTSVRESGQLAGVFVVDAGSVARYRLVKTAVYDLERLELLSGAEPGERILASPGPEVLDGTPVEVRR